jgi:hypothetical protein
MKHVHKYQAISHQTINPQLIDLGIHSAELRRCSKCQKEMMFMLIKKGEWIPVFEDRESDEKDILLA